VDCRGLHWPTFGVSTAVSALLRWRAVLHPATLTTSANLKVICVFSLPTAYPGPFRNLITYLSFLAHFSFYSSLAHLLSRALTSTLPTSQTPSAEIELKPQITIQTNLPPQEDTLLLAAHRSPTTSKLSAKRERLLAQAKIPKSRRYKYQVFPYRKHSHVFTWYWLNRRGDVDVGCFLWVADRLIGWWVISDIVLELTDDEDGTFLRNVGNYCYSAQQPGRSDSSVLLSL
jgi:hypothetical protein